MNNVDEIFKNARNTPAQEIAYRPVGDYLLPDLIPPESPNIGVWGMRRRDYLMKRHEAIYTGMLLRGTLNAHLEEIDQTANEMFDRLMREYAKQEGVTEALKATNQMEWVGRMNNIRNRVEEILLHDLIYQ